MKKKLPWTVMDLFAGCGGLSLGLELAGFRPIFVNEINDLARGTYLINRLERFPYLSRLCSSDIKEMLGKRYLSELRSKLREEGITEIDLLCGGPPCQGYSRIGHRRSYAVEKKEIPSNHLYRDMATLIKAFQPKLFLFENVAGLCSARWSAGGTAGEIWNDVLRTFRKVRGYHVETALVRASDYQVPQRRPRILIVGVKKELGIQPIGDPSLVAAGFLPQASGNAPDLETLLGDLIDPNYEPGVTLETPIYPRDPKNELQEELRRNPEGAVAAKGEKVLDQQYSRHSRGTIRKFRAMQRNGGEIPKNYKTRKFSTRVLPPRWERGPTITATSLPDDYVHWHPDHPRTLTVREWARLQTFPDWYRFCGPRTTGGLRRAGNPREGLHERHVPKYTQIGNAVPVVLARAIGEHFSGLLASID